MSKRSLANRKRIIYKLCNGICIFCKKHVDYDNATIEHYIIPQHARKSKIEANFNLRIACRECNNEHGAFLFFEDYQPIIKRYRTINWIIKKLNFAKKHNETIWIEFYEEWLLVYSLNYNVLRSYL
jgi:hypothetical protein